MLKAQRFFALLRVTVFFRMTLLLSRFIDMVIRYNIENYKLSGVERK